MPIDPQYPEERIAYMLHDARIALLLTQATAGGGIAVTRRIPFIWIAIGRPLRNARSIILHHAITRSIWPISFTPPVRPGKPKGVMVSHRNAVHSTSARFAAYQEPVGAICCCPRSRSTVP